MYKKEIHFTFKKLSFQNVVDLSRDFIHTQLSEVEEVRNGLQIKYEDILDEKSVEEAEETFNNGKFEYIHFYIRQKWGYGNNLNIFIKKHPNELTILLEHIDAEVGKNIISDFIKRLDLIDIYDHRLLKIRNKAERSYMEEALVCRNSNAFRAAIIMGWNCVMHKIYSEINKKFRTEFIIEVKNFHKKNKKFRLRNITVLEDYQQFPDSEILVHYSRFFPNKGVKQILKQNLDLRNNCAHIRAWHPMASTVDSFFDEIFNIIYK